MRASEITEGRMQHILEAQQFTKRLIGELFNEAEAMEAVVARGGGQELRGRVASPLTPLHISGEGE